MSRAEKIREDAGRFAAILRMGRHRPAIVGRYLVDQSRYSRIEREGRPDVEAVRAEYEANAATGQFGEDWFSGNVVPWCVTLSKVFGRDDPVRILEVGSWEGRSSLFLLTYFLKGELTCVDTWAGNDEYSYTTTPELSDLEARFDHNTVVGAGRVTKHKGFSSHVLPRLVEEQQKFDLIYVDGSHFADDVLTDGINAWRLLEPGGVMIFDDLLWNWYPGARDNPAWAIDSLLRYHSGEYDVLSVAYQFMLRKR